MVEQGPSSDKTIFNLDGTDNLAPGSGRDANYGVPAMGSNGSNILVLKLDSDGKSISVVQGQFVDGVPTEITTDGEAASLRLDPFKKLYIFGSNEAEGAIDINDIASDIMATEQPGAQTTLTAPGDGTPVNVELYHLHTWQVVVAAINASVDIKINGSLDGTNYGNTAASATQFTANGTYFICVSDTAEKKFKYLRPEFDAEGGGTDATVTFTYMGGN